MTTTYNPNTAEAPAKPMFNSTRVGLALGIVLAIATIIAAAAMMVLGVQIVTQGALIGALLFNSLFVLAVYRYLARGRSLDVRNTAGLILLVMAFASGLGMAIASVKAPAYVALVALYGLAYLVAFGSFTWDMSDDS